LIVFQKVVMYSRTKKKRKHIDIFYWCRLFVDEVTPYLVVIGRMYLGSQSYILW